MRYLSAAENPCALHLVFPTAAFETSPPSSWHRFQPCPEQHGVPHFRSCCKTTFKSLATRVDRGSQVVASDVISCLCVVTLITVCAWRMIETGIITIDLSKREELCSRTVVLIDRLHVQGLAQNALVCSLLLQRSAFWVDVLRNTSSSSVYCSVVLWVDVLRNTSSSSVCCSVELMYWKISLLFLSVAAQCFELMYSEISLLLSIAS